MKLQYIPYKGSQPLNTDLIGGFVKVGFNPIPVSRAAIEGKLIRALAATSLKRSAAFPDLPTVAESGLPGYDAVLTYGIVAPAGTPRPIVDKLNKVLRETLATDEVKRRLAQEGAEPMPTTPEEYAAVIDREDDQMVGDHQVGRHPGANEECRDMQLRAVAALSLSSLRRLAASAQDYPTRPITLVVPYAAGGGNDIMARTAADKMSPTLGQQIVIENRGGAGGSIATRQVAQAAPDGYTLVIGGTGTLAINPTLYPNVGYDPRKDFAPVGLIGIERAVVLVIHPSIPAHIVKELIALAKANPGKLNFASAGVGSGIHLAAEYFRGDGRHQDHPCALQGHRRRRSTDLVGGHVSMYFSSLPPAIGLVKDGKVRALAVTGPQRSPMLPGPADGRGSRPARLRGGAALRHRRARPARRSRSSTSSTRRCDEAVMAPDELKQKLAADGTEPLPSTPGGIRRRHRPGRDQMVGDHQEVGRQGRSEPLHVIPARRAAASPESITPCIRCSHRLPSSI